MTGIALGVLAFVVRLVPVLRRGGVTGLANYDDGVYYAAAVGLVHARMPYRDFLLLHPPGVVVALSPFAGLGELVGDPIAFAVARVAWMALGGISAVLVWSTLRAAYPVGAVVGAVFFAIYFPAVFGNHTIQLEGLATVLVLIAVRLLTRCKPIPTTVMLLLAGAALGASAAVKIWGVVGILVVVVWVLAASGLRRALLVIAGVAAGAVVLCLPFFLADPVAMWRMVGADQLGRPGPGAPALSRLSLMVGQSVLHRLEPGSPALVLLVGLVGLGAGAIVMACTSRIGRLAVALLGVSVIMLLLTPSWFAHYSALIAGPAALTVGAGAGVALGWVRQRSRGRAIALTVLVAVLLTLYAVPLVRYTPNRAFPGPQLRTAVATVPGCVTADDTSTLILLNALGRNLDRGCVLVVDLGGHSYDVPPTPGTRRSADRSFQRYVRGYLLSGEAVIITRFRAHHGYSTSTVAAVERWPALATSGRYVVRIRPRRP